MNTPWPITIEQCVGRKKGVLVTEPLDWIVAHHPVKGRVRIGHVWRYEGAVVKLTRWFRQEMREAIYQRVKELRKEVTAAQVAERPSSIPDPRLIAAYLNGELRRRRKTLRVPDGLPSAESKSNERKRLYVPGRD